MDIGFERCGYCRGDWGKVLRGLVFWFMDGVFPGLPWLMISPRLRYGARCGDLASVGEGMRYTACLIFPPTNTNCYGVLMLGSTDQQHLCSCQCIFTDYYLQKL